MEISELYSMVCMKTLDVLNTTMVETGVPSVMTTSTKTLLVHRLHADNLVSHGLMHSNMMLHHQAKEAFGLMMFLAQDLNPASLIARETASDPTTVVTVKMLLSTAKELLMLLHLCSLPELTFSVMMAPRQLAMSTG